MSFQAYLDNIEEKTGKTPREFIALARERGYDDPAIKSGVIVDWLKADFDLGRGHAMACIATSPIPCGSTARQPNWRRPDIDDPRT